MRLLVESAALCLLIGAPTFAHSQQEPQQQDEKAKKQQEEKQKQAPEPREEKRQEEPARQQNDRAKQEDRTRQDKQQEMIKQQEKQQKEMEKQRKSQEQLQRQEEPRGRGGEERTQQSQLAGGHTRHGGRVIAQEKFQAHFGREHHFHAHINRGDPHFAYGGYTFEYVEVWPAEWSYDDDFYIDYYDDDYYLCDVEHPEVRLVVIVVG